MSESQHPEEGDFLNLTSIVHDRCIMGLELPNGYKYGNGDGRFDEYTVYVEKVENIFGDESRQKLTVRKPSGQKTTVTYKGRGKIGSPESPLRQQNNQRASQAWNWEKA